MTHPTQKFEKDVSYVSRVHARPRLASTSVQSVDRLSRQNYVTQSLYYNQIRHRLESDKSFLPKVKTALDKLESARTERRPRCYTSMKEIRNASTVQVSKPAPRRTQKIQIKRKIAQPQQQEENSDSDLDVATPYDERAKA